MAFKAGAIVGDAVLNTAKWTSGVGIVQSTSKKLGGALTTLAKVGFAAVAAGMTAAVYKANEYQKAFSNVSTLTDQNTRDLQKMSLGLLRLDSELGSTTELARSMYDAISAGAKPGKQAFDVVTSSAKFAKAAMADNAASVRLLSATVNAYGKDAKTMSGNQLDAAAASDIFFKTIKLGVVTGEQLSSTIGQSIPLFASMKIPVEELAAGMAAMTKQGVNASEATTQLNAIVNAFLKPSQALTKVLQEQGYESGQAFIQAEGLSGALELLNNSTASGDYEIAQLTRNIRAMKGVLALSGEGAKIFKDTLNEMGDASGATDTAFRKQEKTFQTFQNELSKTAVIAGNVGKYFVDDIAGGAQSALESLNQFIVSGRALQTFSTIAAKVGGAFSVVKEFASEVYHLFADNLNQTIQDLKDQFNDLFASSIKQGDVFDALSEAVNILGAGFNILLSVVKLMISNFLDLIKIGVEVAKTFGSVWQVITGKKQFSEVKDNLNNIKEGFITFGKDYAENVVNIVKESQKQWNNLTDNAKDNSQSFADAWETGSKHAYDAVQKNYTAAVSGVKNGENEVLNTIENQNNAMEEGLTVQNEIVTEKLEENKSIWEGWNQYVKDNLTSLFDHFVFWSESVIETINMTLSGLSDISDLYYQNESDKLTIANNERLATLKKGYDKETADLTAKLNKGLITESQYNEKTKAIDKKYESDKTQIEQEALADRNEIGKKQFENKKALSLAQLWIDAGSAAIGFWKWAAPLGPPAWIAAGIQTVAVTTMAAVKSSLINAQQYVPEYASGTNYHPGGAAMVNDAGPEIIDLPTGSRVIPAGLSEQMFSDSNKDITININNAVVREESDINKIADAVSEVFARQLRTA